MCAETDSGLPAFVAGMIRLEPVVDILDLIYDDLYCHGDLILDPLPDIYQAGEGEQLPGNILPDIADKLNDLS